MPAIIKPEKLILMKYYKSIFKSLAAFALMLTAGNVEAAVWKIDSSQLNKAGSQDTVCLSIDANSFNFTSFQVDIKMPDGLLITDKPYIPQEMSDGHSVSWEMQDGKYRCVTYSTGNNLIKNPTGKLLYIPVQISPDFKSGVIEVTNGLIANKKSESEVVPAFSATLNATIIKKKITVNVSGLEQRITEDMSPAEISVMTIPENLPVKREYFLDEKCSLEATDGDRKKEGILYAKVTFAGNVEYEAFEKVYTMVLTTKVDLAGENFVLPKASSLVEGQLLSLSVLSGGSATDGDLPVPGEFVWTDGNQKVIDSGDYSVTFIPQNQTYYNTKEVFVKVDVISTYSVTALAMAGGSVKVGGVSSDNVYTEGHELALEAVADENYEFTSWYINGKESSKDNPLNLTVKEDAAYTAAFSPIEHKVSIVTEGSGKLTVSNENGNISNGAVLQQGTILNVSAVPNAGWQLSKLTVDNVDLNNSNIKLDGPVTIKAVFSLKPVDMYSIDLQLEDGKGSVLAYKIDGTPVVSGSSVPSGTRLQITTLPAVGYQNESITVQGATKNGEEYVVNGNVTVSAKFKIAEFDLKAEAKNSKNEAVTGQSITLSKSKAQYGETVRITEINDDGGILLYILANGKEISKDEEITVTGPLTVTAVFDHKVDILKEYIMWPHQSYYYNGVSRNFVPFASQTYAGFDFDVKYKRVKNGNGEDVTEGELDKAINAGTYTVVLRRDADGLYNKFEQEYEEGLIIKKSTIAVTKEPENNGNPKTRPEEGVKIDRDESFTSFVKYTINPDEATVSNNYNGTVYYYEKQNAPKSTLKFGFGTLRSTESVQGYVRVTNGGLPIEGNNGDVKVTQGIEISIEAVPGDDYKFVKWSDGEIENPRKYTVSDDEVLKPEFALKAEPNISGLTESKSLYTGDVKTVELKADEALKNTAQISFFMDEACTQPAILKNAGKYFVKVYRPADSEYKSFDKVFSYEISQIEPVIIKPTASDIVSGEKLSKSVLTGGNAGIVPGTFAWVSPETEVAKESGEYEVKFTPLDANYKEVIFKVTVKAIGGTKSEGGTDPEEPTDPTDPTDPEDPTEPENPTSLEDIEARTIITSNYQSINIVPAVPMNVTVINMTGNMMYDGLISSEGKIDVRTPGVYIIKMTYDDNTLVKKINVR